jgi:hypothetical protein
MVAGSNMVYGKRRSPYLFDKHSAHDVVDSQRQSAMKELEEFTETQILTTPTEDLVRYLVDKYKLEAPLLDEDRQHVETQKIKQQIENHGYDIFSDLVGGTHTVTINQVILHIPFTGDSQMFSIQPSYCTIPGPMASVEASDLLITVSSDRKDAATIKSQLQAVVSSIKQHLATLAQDIKHLPSQIEVPARSKIETRKQQILASKNLVASLGFPMTKRPNAPTTYVAPEVRRKITPRLPPASTAAFKPEPALDEATYKAILDIMDNMTKVIERSPSAFVDTGEEAIRQHFLVQLNAQFEGQATGETFNASGKTDILIRSEGRNIFIAECKFWRGEKLYLETIDQLLSYLTWRDTKTALVIFNRNKNLSQVLGTIKSVTDKHPHKKSGPAIEGETRFRYIMGNPDDHSREIIMTVMVYDIPSLAE